MSKKVDAFLNQIAMEKRIIGDVIEFREEHHIPCYKYTAEYKELENIERLLEDYRDGRTTYGSNKSAFRVIPGYKLSGT